MITRRTSSRKRCAALAIAVAMGSIATPGSVWADDPIEPEPTAPTDAGAPAPDGSIEVGVPPAPPTTDEPRVAVGLPPVPPTTAAPSVRMDPAPEQPTSAVSVRAVSRAPVPSAALLAKVDAALDLVADCL